MTIYTKVKSKTLSLCDKILPVVSESENVLKGSGTVNNAEPVLVMSADVSPETYSNMNG